MTEYRHIGYSYRIHCRICHRAFIAEDEMNAIKFGIGIATGMALTGLYLFGWAL